MKYLAGFLILVFIGLCSTYLNNLPPPPSAIEVAAKAERKAETCEGTAELLAGLDVFAKHNEDWSKVYVKRFWHSLPVDDKRNVLGLVRNCLSKNTTVDALDNLTGKRVAYYHNLTGFGVD